MFSIRLHLLRNPNNRLVRVSSSPGTLMRRAEKWQCIRSHYTSNTILERTATQVHVETVSEACVTIWSRHRTTSSTETVPHGCPLSFTVLNWLFWLSVQILLYLRTYKPLLLICWDCLVAIYWYRLATLSINYFSRFSTCPGNYTRTTCTPWWTKPPMAKNMSLTRKYT